MSNELVINSTEKGERIALLQNKRLLEYHLESSTQNFTVGDIYLGTVKKLVAGLNAAFVDVGYEKDAFLHYLDLGPKINSLNQYTRDVIAKRANITTLKDVKIEPDIDKQGKIDKVLAKGQPILVQIVKEPISTKGPRLSCDISIAGRYIVLVPFGESVNLSKKITERQERQRLQRLMSSIKPPNFGVIVRTVAQGRDVDELNRDLQSCIEKWDRGMKLLQEARPRERIIGEMNRTSSILRDMLNETFDSITVDSKDVFEDTKTFIRTIAPDKEGIVKFYSGKTRIFEQYGLEKQIKSLFGRSVSLPGGGYLIVEHTEALHVIDVNSGNKSNSEEDQEATALSVNIEAAKEIARQLRLRDMGGIIVVDFIDMKKADNRKTVYETMRDVMKTERSKYTILPLSKFGLMQITRQRVRPELNVVTRETCPACNGTGNIQASILVTDSIESHLDYILTKQNERAISIVLHPYLHAYFTKGLLSRQRRWFLKYKTWVTLIPDSSVGITEFKFHNRFGEEMELAG